MLNDLPCRWPPIYDADDLRETIHNLIASDTLFSSFYATPHTFEGVDVCQGDIVSLEAGVPVIWEDVNPAVHVTYSHWLIIGNTCDFQRPIDDTSWMKRVPWTQMVPLRGLSPDPDDNVLEAFRRYQYSRYFYLPPDPEASLDMHHVANLMLPVAIHKRAFSNGHVRVIARLQFSSWILLHPSKYSHGSRTTS